MAKILNLYWSILLNELFSFDSLQNALFLIDIIAEGLFNRDSFMYAFK